MNSLLSNKENNIYEIYNVLIFSFKLCTVVLCILCIHFLGRNNEGRIFG